MIVNGSGGKLTFADLEITGTHYFDDVNSNTNTSATITLELDDVDLNTCIKVHMTFVAVAKNSFHGLNWRRWELK